ncbi:hypothetical protein FALBO_14463 [Fusarium albosuccineum]|uniref:Uncharacterized protein n=1 Tax=Fusarium albosuccineum TaxID=1237068 RepID=A0A8H4P4F4_9HYPO|nr:hypothetical protein FALBO_14463 [Fusarium albosuccineum]
MHATTFITLISMAFSSATAYVAIPASGFSLEARANKGLEVRDAQTANGCGTALPCCSPRCQFSMDSGAFDGCSTDEYISAAAGGSCLDLSEKGAEHLKLEHCDGLYMDVNAHDEESGTERNKIKVYKGDDSGHPIAEWWMRDCKKATQHGQCAVSEGGCSVEDKD